MKRLFHCEIVHGYRIKKLALSGRLPLLSFTIVCIHERFMSCPIPQFDFIFSAIYPCGTVTPCRRSICMGQSANDVVSIPHLQPITPPTKKASRKETNRCVTEAFGKNPSLSNQ